MLGDLCTHKVGLSRILLHALKHEAAMIDAIIKALKGRPSEKMLELFAATKKSESEKICQKLMLNDSDLASIIMGCSSIGYSHTPRYFDTDADHLWAKVRKDRSPQNFKQMFKQIQKEAKRTVFHFFTLNEDSKIWHMIFYDTNEYSGMSRFTAGSHLHFVNYLWGLDVDSILERLPERPRSSAHIKVRSEQFGTDVRAGSE